MGTLQLVYIIVLETCEAIAQHFLMRYVGFPQGQELTNIVNGFDAIGVVFHRLLVQLMGPTYLLFGCRTIPLTTIIVKIVIWF